MIEMWMYALFNVFILLNIFISVTKNLFDDTKNKHFKEYSWLAIWFEVEPALLLYVFKGHAWRNQ